MFIESAYGKNYVLTALTAGPMIYPILLKGIANEEVDFTPDPNRFTIREALSHLADWEPIFLDRINKMVNENNPMLPGYDEWQMAIDRNYKSRDWKAELERFQEGRQANLDYLSGLPEEAWSRPGVRDEIGPVTVEYIGILMSLHDSYHAKQMVEWRAAYARVGV